MESQGKFAYVRTAAGEFAITIDGKPAGLPVGDEADAATISEWLASAAGDVGIEFIETEPERPRTVAEAYALAGGRKLAELIDAAYCFQSKHLRKLLHDALVITGPAWHAFAEKTEVCGNTIYPNESALMVPNQGRVNAYIKGMIPHWVKKKWSTWDSSKNVVLPGSIERQFRAASHPKPARPATIPATYSYRGKPGKPSHGPKPEPSSTPIRDPKAIPPWQGDDEWAWAPSKIPAELA